MDGGAWCLEGMEYHFYQYNCSTKKARNLAIAIPTCWISIAQANKGRMLFLDWIYEWWWNNYYRIFDIKNMSISSLNIQKFKWFIAYKDYVKWELEKIFNITDKKFISAGYPTKINGGVFAEYWGYMDTYFPYNWYDGLLEINDISSKFVWNLGYRVGLSSNDDGAAYSISENRSVKIDFLNKKIIME